MLNGDMYSCNSGVSYEDAVVAFLNEHGFQAYKTGKSDGGIDIVAVSTTKPQSYTFNIQCKYYNKPLGKAPIQEVYSGTQYYGNGGKPVVVTNNRMTADARVYEEKVYYLKKYGFWDDLQKNSAHLEMLLSTSKKHKQGTSNEQTCILTCKDRSGNLYVNPVCIGRMGIADVKKNLTGRFASDAIMVTDSHNAYPAFARDERIHLEQIEADKHTNGAFNLSRINSTHSKLKAYWSKERGRQPATKYMDLSLMLFWWLEKNGTLSTAEKVDKLGEIMSAKMDTSGTDYESITNREMTLNTKGLFPNKV